MDAAVRAELSATLAGIRDAGLYKKERKLTGPQSAHVETAQGSVLNFCANNYLGLADDPTVVAAAKAALDEWGFGMASVRFICGTQTLHARLEQRLSEFLGTEDTILFSSCYDANGGVFEALLGEQDVVISDELNHASLIDGIRLSRARRLRYRNRDLGELEDRLKEASKARWRVIVTDGVFSMDGSYAPLEGICDLADQYRALVLVDDSHAVGFVGENGRGTPELLGVADSVDILTGTLGKALGGASGGYVSGPAEVVDLLRQSARPYLFSNSIPPSVVAGSLAALELVSTSGEARERLEANSRLFRELMAAASFDLLPGRHPIVPVMFPGEDGARTAAAIADHMLEEGVYVIAFSYPVVPKGKARIRVQLSSAHTADDVRACVRAFTTARDVVARNS